MRFYVFLLLIAISTASFSAKKQNTTSRDLRDSLVRYAKTLINKPYRSGSKGPSGFDCSGYTSYVYGKFGISLNSSSGSQVSNGAQTTIDDLKKGDLVFFKGHNSKNSRIGHVGIFLDHNSDGSFNFIHSANGGGVRIDNSFDPYYSKRYVTACTVLASEKKPLKYTPTAKTDAYSDVQYASTGKTHKVKKGESLYTIAKEYKVTEDQIKEWNHLENNNIQPGQKLNIQQEKAQASPSKIHVVKKGDTFYSIAKQYKISEEDLLKANNNNHNIKPGDKITIATTASQTRNETQDEAKTSTSRSTHKVKKGETLSEIAEKYNTTSAKLRQLNGLKGSNLQPGKILIVQVKEKTESVTKNTPAETSQPGKSDISTDQLKKTVTSRKTHKIKKGETLSEIAEKYNTTSAKLRQLNNLKNNKLQPGKTIVVEITKTVAMNEEPRKTSVTETTTKTQNISPEKTEKAIPSENATKTKTVTSRKTHKVRKGETLSEIAEKYNTTSVKLRQLNNLKNNKLQPGKTIVVEITKTVAMNEEPRKTSATETTVKPQNISPEKTEKAILSENATKTKTVTSRKTHKVRKGETLSEIAEKYNTTSAKLRQLNNIKGSNLQPGKTLIVKITETEVSVPDTKPAMATSANKTNFTTTTKKHKVRKGETLSAIASKYDVTIAQLKKWNHLTNTKVKPGTTLTIQFTEKITAQEPNSQPQITKKTETTEVVSVNPNEKTHVVTKGETLYSIAKTHHLSALQIKEWNNKNDNQVHEGDTLILDATLRPKEIETAQTEVKSESEPKIIDTTSVTKRAQEVSPIVYNQPTDKIDTLTTTYKINKTHIVEEDETLESIADAYNVTPAQIKQWNGISKRKNTVSVGQKLVIETTQREYVVVSAKKKRPAKGKAATATKQVVDTTQEQPIVTSPKQAQIKYTVKKGETLFTIARSTNLTVDQLKEYNRLTTAEVKENQVLSLIPDSTAAKNPAETKKGDNSGAKSISYIVKPGDTLLSIAKAYNVTADELKAANELPNNEVNIGQHLMIPSHEQ